RNAFGEVSHSRVWVAMVVGADRANDNADRPLQGPHSRSQETAPPVKSIATAVLCGLHLMVDENDLALHGAVGCGSERVEAREIGDLALDPLGARRTAVAKRSDRKRLRQEGAGEPRLFFPALPDGHLIVLVAHLGDAH